MEWKLSFHKVQTFLNKKIIHEEFSRENFPHYGKTTYMYVQQSDDAVT